MARLSRRKKALFSLLVTVGFLLALEGVCRLYFWARSTTEVEDAVVDRFHPMRYDLVPGRSIPANGATATINNVGLRGADADVPKKRIRVLCLGDSATFGYAPDVTDVATYPALLGEILETTHPGRYEVLNAGRPSFSTLDCLGFFSYRASELEPDIVVLMMGWNDTHLAHPLERPADRPVPNLLESCAVWRMMRLILGKFVKPRVPNANDLRMSLKRLHPTDKLSAEVFRRDERTLEDLAQTCRARGAKPILIRLASPVRDAWSGVDSLNDDQVRLMTPHLIGGEMSPGGWTRFVRTANASIDRVGKRLNVPVVTASGLENVDQFVDVCHPNAKGNKILAEAVVKAIESIK